jgi:hypothetical protein
VSPVAESRSPTLRTLVGLTALVVTVVILGVRLNNRAKEEAALEASASRLPTQQAGASAAPSTPHTASANALRVLFVGNSYTYANGLPRMVQRLAAGAGAKRPLFPKMLAPGGFSFARHFKAQMLGRALKDGRWDFVVLQEQSQLPSFSRQQCARDMYPFARKLHAQARKAGATSLFFLTWGRQAGDKDNSRLHPNDTFEAMQKRLNEGYGEIARELQTPLVPVGPAWQAALAQRPDLDLWVADGSHPSRSGTYLAACMFLRAFYGEQAKVVGNPFVANLDPGLAKFLQGVAVSTSVEWAAASGGRARPDKNEKTRRR